MQIILDKVGIFEHAEYELSELNIICGENNTGKTYATYALFGFIAFWKNYFTPDVATTIDPETYKQLMDTGTCIIPLNFIEEYIKTNIDQACKLYSEEAIMNVFAGNTKYFENAKFGIKICIDEIKILEESYEKKWQSPNGNQLLQIIKKNGESQVLVNVLSDTEEMKQRVIQNHIRIAINVAFKEIIFGKIFPNTFIASAERTGAVIFKNELNIDQNALLKEIAQDSEINTNTLLDKIFNNKFHKNAYALPVRSNIDFIRKLDEYVKNESDLVKNYPDILSKFDDLIGGRYKVEREGLFYIPKGNKSVRLTMGESSSSVRALLDIGFYLRHVAKIGDLFIIDEPELNLHPKNQRKLAKLFASLVNIGIRIFITTHSDYIIKELNTLIMLNGMDNQEHKNAIMNKYGYSGHELIRPEKIKVYISRLDKVLLPGTSRKSKIPTLVKADIDPFYGIEAPSFDTTINEMNQIQKSIMFG